MRNYDTAEDKALWRLSVLKLADRLSNISEACRRSGMDRASYYVWKERYKKMGMDGLYDLPPIPRSHPEKTPESCKRAIIQIASIHPDWGCKRISSHLKQSGVFVSSPTVQKILIASNLASIADRIFRLEKTCLEGKIIPTEEQTRIIERLNPIFREHNSETTAPGELLCQGVTSLGVFGSVGKVYSHIAVDTFNSFGFAHIYISRSQKSARNFLFQYVFPTYAKWGVEIIQIQTNTSTIYRKMEESLYCNSSIGDNIVHDPIWIHKPARNGFLERFTKVLKDEFLLKKPRNENTHSLLSLQSQLDEWLQYYNYEREHKGYRNFGKPPAKFLQKHLINTTARHVR